MHICEEPGFWRLHKNMNCAFPLSRWYKVKLIWSNLLNQINQRYTSKFWRIFIWSNQRSNFEKIGRVLFHQINSMPIRIKITIPKPKGPICLILKIKQKVSNELNLIFRCFFILKENYQINWIRSADRISI